MKNKAIIFILTGILFLAGCSGVTDKAVKNTESIYETQNQDNNTVNAPKLGGISLGDTSESVAEKLGNEYIAATETDSMGIIGEDMVVWTYENGLVVHIGASSGKVLRVASTSPDIVTDLGIKAGDDAKTVFETYKSKYEEAVSRHSDEALDGWFLVDDDTVLIFDFDKSDNEVVNGDIKPDSTVEEIILAHWSHFD